MSYVSSDTTEIAKTVIKRLESINALPAIPKVINEISQLFNSSDISARKIEMLVEKDPSLTLKILSVANSPLFGLRRNVNTIGTAVLILGVREIKSIITSVLMASSLKMKADKYFDPNRFLNHSMSVGMLTQRMAKDLGFNFEGHGFVAGMLHDMGILTIHEFFPKEFSDIIDHSIKNGTSFIESENVVLGLSHQEIGEFLTNKWSLPDIFSDALQFHHNPGNSKQNNYLTSILHIADYATFKFSTNDLLWDDNYKIDSSIIDLLNFLSEEDLIDFIEAYRADYLEVSNSKMI